MSLFDHIGFRSKDVGKSLAFYRGCMSVLGLDVVANSATSFFVSGGERAPVPFVWVHGAAGNGKVVAATAPKHPGNYLHVMFTAANSEMVDAFHKAALASGGVDSGIPGYQGPKEMSYYAAIVFDPDGNTLEAGFRERRK